MNDEHVLVLGGSVKAAMAWGRRRGIDRVIAITSPGQLVDLAGHLLIVLPGYIQAPRHAELLIAARKYGLEIQWER